LYNFEFDLDIFVLRNLGLKKLFGERAAGPRLSPLPSPEDLNLNLQWPK